MGRIEAGDHRESQECHANIHRRIGFPQYGIGGLRFDYRIQEEPTVARQWRPSSSCSGALALGLSLISGWGKLGRLRRGHVY